jgi:acyl-CoA synthetase (AMP-forming)/AMP-acid ligase II
MKGQMVEVDIDWPVENSRISVRMEVVSIEALPIAATGKILKNEIRARFIGGRRPTA